MDDPDAIFEQWKNKQKAVGRAVPETTAPHVGRPRKKRGASNMPDEQRRQLLAIGYGYASYETAHDEIRQKIDDVIDSQKD